MDTINLFFDPKSVVLFGATDRPGTVGQVTLKNLLSSQDSRKVYIVHPKHETLMETRCYPKLSTLPEVPELAIIATGADSVASIVEECGIMGIKAILIISSGFKEAGEKGQDRETLIMEYAKKYGMRIMGRIAGAIRPGSGLKCHLRPKGHQAGQNCLPVSERRARHFRPGLGG